MRKTKKLLSMLLITAILCIAFSIPVFSASTRKCYTITSGNTAVYSNMALTNKYGTIYGSDEIIVITVTDRYTKVTYPISGGRTKTGYIKTGAILTGTTGPSYTAKGKITTYRRPGGYAYGYVSSGDRVTVLGTYGNYVQIKYPVSFGYKYGFITKENANRYIYGTVSPRPATPTVTTTAKLSYGLYKNSKAYISCKFDGYTTTSGRHEGIDFVCYQNAPVYSLTEGTVVRIQYGYNGSKGLSTIAIYDSSANKTVIYLHSNPLFLRAGQKIYKGQQIATQGWRGVSSSRGSHTHVEVRNGKQGYAAKSVGDYKLDNPNPQSYWNSKGYTVQ
ncbi:MAG: M23 family metallopeptidase [Eubacteriales bacterium]|nr:M23 family metallopeptidase [Eubacteriales bacterium]